MLGDVCTLKDWWQSHRQTVGCAEASGMAEAGSPTASTSCPAGSEESEMENGVGA